MRNVHTRTVGPKTLFGKITSPVRTFPCRGCGTGFRSGDAALGMPAARDFTDDVHAPYAPLAAELPRRIANDPLQRNTGVVLSSREAPSLIGSTVWGLLFFPSVLILFVALKRRVGQYIGWYSGLQVRLHALA